MTSFYSIILLYLASFLSKIKAENMYAAYRFTRHFNSKIRCGVFQTLDANSMDCQDLCADTLRCFSVNTYRFNGVEKCQLSRESSKTSNAADNCLVSSPGTTHHELTVIHFSSCKIVISGPDYFLRNCGRDQTPLPTIKVYLVV